MSGSLSLPSAIASSCLLFSGQLNHLLGGLLTRTSPLLNPPSAQQQERSSAMSSPPNLEPTVGGGAGSLAVDQGVATAVYTSKKRSGGRCGSEPNDSNYSFTYSPQTFWPSDKGPMAMNLQLCSLGSGNCCKLSFSPGFSTLYILLHSKIFPFHLSSK